MGTGIFKRQGRKVIIYAILCAVLLAAAVLELLKMV